MIVVIVAALVAVAPVTAPEGNSEFKTPASVPAAIDSPPGWTPDTLLSLNDVQESREPSLAIDSRGRLHAVWKDNRRLHGRDEVHYRCKDSTGWGELFSVGNLDTVHNWPDVAVDAADNVHVSFMRWYGAPYDYYDVGYRRRDGVTGDWGAEERLTVNDSLGHSAYPQTVCIGDTVFVFWFRQRLTPAEIVYSYNNGSGWSAPERVTKDDAVPAGYYDIHATPDGWLHVIWQDNRSDTLHLWHRFHSGDSWSEPERVTFHDYQCIEPDMDSDSAGNIALVYSGGDPEDRLHYRVWDRGTMTWGPVTHFYSWSGVPYPKVGVNKVTGEAHLTHVGHQGVWCLGYRRLDPGTGQWTDSTMLTWYDVATGPAKPVLDADGYVHLVFWDQRYGSQEEIQYKTNRLASGAAEESSKCEVRSASRPTFVRGVLPWDCQPVSSGETGGCTRPVLLDAAGRRVMVLVPGENDVGHLAPGVYFVREDGPRVRGSRGPRVTKVVIGR